MDWPTKQYDVIYADPGWKYDNFKTGAGMESGAGQLYTVASFEDLAAMPVADIAAKNSVLFMWATTPMKFDAGKLMEAWGFNYKTTLYWHKCGKPGKPGRIGMGWWFRGEVEELLFGIRGHVPAFKTTIRNHHRHPHMAHSQKPELFRHLIEKATTPQNLMNRVELFARKYVDGWDAWGDELLPREEEENDLQCV